MISVITITHNRIHFLSKAIRSVLEQEFSHFEYIVVDDGSDEPIAELIKEFNDARIKHIYTNRTGHIPSLRNTGLDQAKGQIICFLDNDDLWKPSYLSKVNESFGNKDTMSVISNGVISTEKTNTVLFKNFASDIPANLLEQKLFDDRFVIYPSCFSFRNTGTRLNKEFKFGDNDLMLRVLASGNTHILTDTLVTITKHDENMSSANTYDSPFIQAYFEELQTLIFLKQSNTLSEKVYRRAASKYYYKLALNLLHLKMRNEARSNFLNSYKSNPGNYKSLLRYLFS